MSIRERIASRISHLLVGQAAENAAEHHLKKHGLKLVAKNFRCKYGEIDLIMHDDNTLVFVEVRLRRHQNFGGAAMSIDAAKQSKLRRSAEHYLQTYGEQPCRFDVVLMQSTDVKTLEWLKNAF